MAREDLQDALIGKKCGNYQLERVLGSGGMGTVYAALHPTLGKRVAIKVLRPELAGNRKAVGRLIDEARASTAIGHKNIIEVFDIGETPEGITYLAMELLEGETLQQALQREGRLDPARAIGIARQICAALSAAHRRGIIHRDLKPQNVFLVAGERGVDQVKVLDFGAAKLLDDLNRISPATATGALIGTPFYMAPEQARGQPVDGRTDIWALGVILFRCLTGLLPFVGETTTEVLLSMLTDAPPTFSSLAPEAGVPPELEQLVLGTLSKDPAGRPPDLSALDAGLAACLPPGEGALPETTSPRAPGDASPERPPTLAAPARPPERPASTPATPRPDQRMASLERSGLVESAVTNAEGRVRRRMLWLRFFLYPSLYGFLLLGYFILLSQGLADASLVTEILVVGGAAVLVAYVLELLYHLAGKRRLDPRPLHLLLITSFVLVGTYALQLNGTLTNYMVVFYAIMISFTRIRLDNRAAWFATLLSIGCFLGVVLLESAGVIPYARMIKSLYSPTLTHERAFTAVIVVGSVVFLLLSHLGAHVLVHGLETREEAISEVTRGLEGQVAEQIEVLRRRERLRHFVPAPVVEAVVQGESEVRVRYARQKISVVYARLDGFFDRTASLDPEDQSRVLNDFFEAASRVAQRFGAVIDGFRGAEVILLLGAPRSQGDAEHATGAVRTALAILHLLAEVQLKWRALGVEEVVLQVGVHTGYATVGNFGSEIKLQFTALGPAIPLAEGAAHQGRGGVVMVTHPTKMLCTEAYRFERRGEVRVEGMAAGDAIPVYLVIP
jgi:serine/threonine protein kinase/class 3 adenylate cyclase